MQLKTDGIILRETMVGESDKMLTILTREYGVLGGYCKNARNPRSRKASGVSVMTYSRFMLFHHGGRYIVDGAEPIKQFMGLREDVVKLSLAAYFGELIRCLAPEGEPAEEFLRLMLNSLHLLCGENHPIGQIKAVFELRALELGGHMPDLVACAGCGAFSHEVMVFYPRRSTILCGDCAAGHASGGDAAIPLPAGTLAAMRHIIYSEFEKIFSFNLSGDGLSVLERATEQNLVAQLDRGFSTLDFYKAMQSDMKTREYHS